MYIDTVLLQYYHSIAPCIHTVLLTVSRSISSTFIPGPLFSIIFEMYCFTASVTFMMATPSKQQQQQQQNNNNTAAAAAVYSLLQSAGRVSEKYQLSCCDNKPNTAESFLPGW